MVPATDSSYSGDLTEVFVYFQICYSHWQGLRDICLRGWGLGSSAVQQVVSEIRCFIPLLYPLDQLYPQIDTRAFYSPRAGLSPFFF